MSRHEGVSCDACMKSNFRGRRFKCLLCYDYDLCSSCYEAGATTSRHASDHPMQCILTRADYELYYHGESLALEQPQAYTCPHCGKMGFHELALQEHATQEHNDVSQEVICPVCASMPGGEPNHMTDDLGGHLALEHRAPASVIEEAHGIGLRHMRRLPPPSRGLGNSRTRQRTQQLHSSGGTLIGLVSNSRDVSQGMDPISELLSQLSSVRNRSTPSAQSVSSQLQQLEMQLQSTRHQLERLPRHQRPESSRGSHTPSQGSSQSQGLQGASTTPAVPGQAVKKVPAPLENFLLPRLVEDQQEEQQQLGEDNPELQLYLHDVLMSSLMIDTDLHEIAVQENFLDQSTDADLPTEQALGDGKDQENMNCSSDHVSSVKYASPSLVPPPAEGVVSNHEGWQENNDVHKVRAHNSDTVSESARH